MQDKYCGDCFANGRISLENLVGSKGNGLPGSDTCPTNHESNRPWGIRVGGGGKKERPFVCLEKSCKSNERLDESRRIQYLPIQNYPIPLNCFKILFKNDKAKNKKKQKQFLLGIPIGLLRYDYNPQQN